MNVVEIVFSPTGGTEKVAQIIGKVWGGNAVKIDLTDFKADFETLSLKGVSKLLKITNLQ